ncbi:hypothetical protein L873DRAFT_1820600 [Choiromyces venosus 120613-1]|uniref:DDE-1 domain-containing protein n=1 Tax=Choiromyces venosus 120613-1 TaxID=1336337 RepID=A0A3N4IX41_9PEZI|nr:hypothetical protein L873DRAFT_1820600 [Choiromyces venosus 120613-1]
MDLATFHIRDSILATLHENNIIPSIIPGRCTRLQQLQDDHVTIEDIGKWTISEKRIMTTHVVSHAWKVFCQQKQSFIVKAFRDVGVMLPIDGSQDGDIEIKGFTTSEIDIGNWAEDLTISQSSQASQSYHTLSTETSEDHSLHYIWQCEGYDHKGD